MQRIINDYLNGIASGKAFVKNKECGFLTDHEIQRIEQAKETKKINKQNKKMIKDLVNLAFADLQLQGINKGA